MNEQWKELKETIIELRDGDGTGTQQEVCKFLANYMDILEKQMQEPCKDVPDINDGNIYECSCGYGWDKSKVVRHHFCPNCGKAVEPSYNSIKTELKPCDDAVSRQAVLDIVDSYSESQSNVEDVTQDIISDIVALPPVTPQPKSEDIAKAFQMGLAIGFGERYDELDKVINEIKKVITPKTGHWIFVDKAHEHAHCSECDYGNVDLLNGRPHNYCPNCGARIIDTQEESEVKDDF